MSNTNKPSMFEVFKCEKLQSRKEIRDASRAVSRIFILGEKGETKSGIKMWKLGNYKLIAQNPETKFGKKITDLGYNTKRVFWLMKDKKYLGVVLFFGSGSQSKRFILPKNREEFLKEVDSILEAAEDTGAEQEELPFE